MFDFFNNRIKNLIIERSLFMVDTINIKEEMKINIQKKVECSLFLLEGKIEKDKDTLYCYYKNEILNIIENIEKLQKDKQIKEISILCFMLSRINISNNILKYIIFLYQEDINQEAYNIEFDLDVSPFYLPLIEIKEKIEQIYKKNYFISITSPEIEKELYKYIKYFNLYFVQFFTILFKDTDIQEKINLINTKGNFSIIQKEIDESIFCIYQRKKKEIS